MPAEASALPMPASNGTDPTVPAANSQERADRDAIEAVWRQAWLTYETIPDVPAEERRDLVYASFTDPVAAQLLELAAKADANGDTFFGHSVLHPFWYRAVNGLDYAVMGDCRDSSETGSMNRATGQVRWMGKADSTTVGSFVKDPLTGGWKVFQVTNLPNLRCTPGQA